MSFAFSDNFIDLVESLEKLLEGESFRYPDESTYFWFDMLVNNLWAAKEKGFVGINF